MKREISKEALRYLTVGAIGYVIDTGLFNILALYSDLGFENLNPLANKVVSTSVAVAFTYIGNSRWTFKTRSGRPEGFKRVALYGAVNIFAVMITLVPLAVSRLVLGFDSLLADNVSANLIGPALAVFLRFVAARYIVFPR
jgi:putative flippase GtrA